MSAPTITAADVKRLVEVLDGATGWMIAAEVAVALWSRDSEANKRRVRAIASAAGAGVVSYPGSPGYKLWTRCTVDELHACVAAYTSQADEMRRRRDLYRMRLHRQYPANFDRPAPELKPSQGQITFL
ncbi:MAG: hypothetical protein H2172_16390 [Opitutus sp.]|nr:hypothetical protein [Opitutus sp.]MCS6245412.1 hypothetical protein [Opitutus sp.]MCS6274674.1 hypothetical protein [Opitutus sp.]MCS6275898.1 hypothetical protein [Opitutus sp.]MCS6299785.1 hypothetical protein [Opitutus sp.]